MAEGSLIGKQVEIFFDDGNRVIAKKGIIKNSDSDFVYLMIEKDIEALNKSRIVRIEFPKGIIFTEK